MTCEKQKCFNLKFKTISTLLIYKKDYKNENITALINLKLLLSSDHLDSSK